MPQKTLVPAAIPFYGQELLSVQMNKIPYAAMKPIVKNMGLDWYSQSRKINSSDRYSQMTMPFKTKGGVQCMLCIPIKKLNGWLFSINPQKVKPSIKDTVIRYQEECFQVLHDYWHHGKAEKPVPKKEQPSQPKPPKQHHIPTELGRVLGLSPQKFNKLLKSQGYQIRQETPNGFRWIPAKKGEPYFNIGTSRATPILQTKWKSEIMDDLMPIFWHPFYDLGMDYIRPNFEKIARIVKEHAPIHLELIRKHGIDTVNAALKACITLKQFDEMVCYRVVEEDLEEFRNTIDYKIALYKAEHKGKIYLFYVGKDAKKLVVSKPVEASRPKTSPRMTVKEAKKQLADLSTRADHLDRRMTGVFGGPKNAVQREIEDLDKEMETLLNASKRLDAVETRIEEKKIDKLTGVLERYSKKLEEFSRTANQPQPA